MSWTTAQLQERPISCQRSDPETARLPPGPFCALRRALAASRSGGVGWVWGGPKDPPGAGSSLTGAAAHFGSTLQPPTYRTEAAGHRPLHVTKQLLGHQQK